MFAPNYLYAKLDKDGNFLFLLPDKTGDVFIVNATQKLNRLGHWQAIRKHIDENKIVPVAKLVTDPDGRARFAYNTTANLSYEKELLIEKKCANLLGVDWEIPIALQATKIVNRAIYFVGSEVIKLQLKQVMPELKQIGDERKEIFA